MAPQAGANRKEPMVAGVLSWLIPGLGSFYAGNNKHGVIHLGIHVVSFVVYVVGLAAAVETYDFSTGTTTGGSFAVAGIGILALLVNDVWSIFTAVGDARAANGGKSSGGRVVGELAPAAPEVRVTSALAMQTGEKRLGVSLLKLAF